MIKRLPCRSVQYALPVILFLVLVLAGCGSTTQNGSQTAGNIKSFFSSYNDLLGPCWFYLYQGGRVGYFSQIQDSQIGVGYTHHYDPGFGCNEYDGEFDRGAVQFDLTPFSGKVVSSASLEFDIVNTYVGAIGYTDRSCIADMLLGTNTWWTQSATTMPAGDSESFAFPDANTTTFSNGAVTLKGGHFTINVALQLNKWLAHSDTNDGFIFAGGDENTDSKDSNTCFSFLNNFKLTLTLV